MSLKALNKKPLTLIGTNMSEQTTAIQQNYTVSGALDRIKQGLENVGLGSGRLQWSDLVGFDQFHIRGLDATKEMVQAVDLNANENILDLGCGLGGPARYLAAEYGARVTGIDITPDFVEIAE